MSIEAIEEDMRRRRFQHHTARHADEPVMLFGLRDDEMSADEMQRALRFAAAEWKRELDRPMQELRAARDRLAAQVAAQPARSWWPF